MPTPTKGRRMGGSAAHQQHMLANLATALFEHGKITTTEARARRLRPRDAVASAGKTLVELFGLARELNVEAEGIDMGPSPTDAALAADLALPIEELNLTVRSYNCLKREGIHSVGELVGRSEQDLLDIRNFGAKSIEEVKQKLIDMNLALKDSPPGFDPGTAADSYGADDDESYVETEQY